MTAIKAASQIVITHEHPDHIAGLTDYPGDIRELHSSLRLTVEQVTDPVASGGLAFPRGALDGYTPISYQDVMPIAPGVALIKAPGHTRGSQMIYVRLESGAEYLFIGDIAWNFASGAASRAGPSAGRAAGRPPTRPRSATTGRRGRS